MFTVSYVWVCAPLLQSRPTLCDPLDHSPPASLSTGLSREKCCNGLSCTPPGDLPDPGTEPESPTMAGSGLPRCSDIKESACNAGDPSSIPRSGRSPGEGSGNPLQYSCLENPMNEEAWQATVHGVAKSRTRLSDFTSLFNHWCHLGSPAISHN